MGFLNAIMMGNTTNPYIIQLFEFYIISFTKSPQVSGIKE